MNHICQSEHNGIGGMRALYAKIGMIASSPEAMQVLVRSHIAYWSGAAAAERASIRQSRGYTLRVAPYGTHGKDDVMVRVIDDFDHRNGVTGWT